MSPVEIEFAFPMAQAPLWFIGGFALVMLAAFGLAALDRRRSRRLDLFIEAALAPRLLAGYDARVRKPLFWLPLLGLAFLLLALAQPRWGRAWVEVTRASRDVLVLLDTSESMNAGDTAPSRLDRARRKVEALVERNPGDRFGLIIFSGAASLEVPLTKDHNYFRAVLHAVDTDTLVEEGTDIAAALDEAARVFAEEAARGGGGRDSRAVFLVTDGEQVTGDAPRAARALGRDAAIFALGVGDGEGVQIRYPDWMRRYAQVPADRQVHVTRLDWETLSAVALEGSGVAVRSTPDNTDILHIQGELDRLRAAATADDRRFTLVNRYRWPLAAAVACFTAEALWIACMPLLRARRLRAGTADGAAEARHA